MVPSPSSSSARLVLVALMLTLVAVHTCSAGPLQNSENSPVVAGVRTHLARAIRSMLNVAGLTPALHSKAVVERQSGMQCMSNQNCTPPQFNNVPESLIQCDNQSLCLCEECFTLNTTSRRCDIDSCIDYYYDPATRMCVDDRPSQLTAFLLSLFLSSTGAANFYIGQTGLAVGQLMILLLVILFPCVFCYISCCMGCCFSSDSGENPIKALAGGFCFIGVTILAVLVAVCCSLALSAWWIADLIIFATNARESGNGCTLMDDL